MVSLFLNSSALVLALAAGLLASTLATDSRRALVLALVLSLGFAYLFMLVHLHVFYSTLPKFLKLPFAPPTHFAWFLPDNLISQIELLISFNTGLSSHPYQFYYGWSRMASAEGWRYVWLNYPVPFQIAWLRELGWLFVESIIGFAAIAVLASWRVRQTWRLEPPSLRHAQLQKFFCAPRFWKSIFRSKMSGLLRRNPIGWLQQYTWSARLLKWGWCLGIVLFECMLVTAPSLSNVWDGQYLLASLLILGIAFTASGSFREERQTGAMELLLITPLKARQILRGRIRGVWGQFLPATVVLVSAWLWLLKDASLFAGRDYTSQTIYRQVFGIVLLPQQLLPSSRNRSFLFHATAALCRRMAFDLRNRFARSGVELLVDETELALRCLFLVCDTVCLGTHQPISAGTEPHREKVRSRFRVKSLHLQRSRHPVSDYHILIFFHHGLPISSNTSPRSRIPRMQMMSAPSGRPIS